MSAPWRERAKIDQQPRCTRSGRPGSLDQLDCRLRHRPQSVVCLRHPVCHASRPGCAEAGWARRGRRHRCRLAGEPGDRLRVPGLPLDVGQRGLGVGNRRLLRLGGGRSQRAVSATGRAAGDQPAVRGRVHRVRVRPVPGRLRGTARPGGWQSAAAPAWRRPQPARCQRNGPRRWRSACRSWPRSPCSSSACTWPAMCCPEAARRSLPGWCGNTVFLVNMIAGRCAPARVRDTSIAAGFARAIGPWSGTAEDPDPAQRAERAEQPEGE